MLAIEVVYALPETQTLWHLQVADGTTVAEAIAQIELPAGVGGRTLAIGIHGERVDSDHRLRAGDRIEIYRDLHIDPKAARRSRVARARNSRS